VHCSWLRQFSRVLTRYYHMLRVQEAPEGNDKQDGETLASCSRLPGLAHEGRMRPQAAETKALDLRQHSAQQNNRQVPKIHVKLIPEAGPSSWQN
jgi:hypothetical protein